MGFDEQLFGFAKRLNRAKSSTVNDISNDVFHDVRGRTPVKTGRARAGWDIGGTDRVAYITNDVPYIKYLEDGTLNHDGYHMVKHALWDAKLKIASGGYNA